MPGGRLVFHHETHFVERPPDARSAMIRNAKSAWLVLRWVPELRRCPSRASRGTRNSVRLTRTEYCLAHCLPSCHGEGRPLTLARPCSLYRAMRYIQSHVGQTQEAGSQSMIIFGPGA